jgi:hypothetical protein
MACRFLNRSAMNIQYAAAVKRRERAFIYISSSRFGPSLDCIEKDAMLKIQSVSADQSNSIRFLLRYFDAVQPDSIIHCAIRWRL